MFSRNRNERPDIRISEQLKDVDACLVRFDSFLRAASVADTSFEALRVLSDSVYEAESAADASLRRLIDSLGGNLLPATRKDLIDIATSCDRIANKCETYAAQSTVQRFRMPEPFCEDVLQILSITKGQFALLEKSIRMLFSEIGKFGKDHSILDDIRAEESRVDDIEKNIYERLYATDCGLAEKMQTARFVELVCDISDVIENIADKIQIMLITRKA